MPFSRSLSTYIDIPPILASARASGGAIYTLDSERAAIRWRARAYQYRRLLLDECERLHPKQRPTTEWDDMKLTLNGPKVIISFFTEVPEGQLTALDGGPAKQIAVDDDLLAFARNLSGADED